MPTRLGPAIKPIAARSLTAPSPIGGVLIQASPLGIRQVRFVDIATAQHADSEHPAAARHASAAAKQLAAYFAGQLRRFTLPLDLRGTAFQERIWGALLEVPYGQTSTYGKLARTIGNPNAGRAVGLANGANPIAVIVPCHRVVGSDGKLTGYAGGTERKRWLLDLEGTANLFACS